MLFNTWEFAFFFAFVLGLYFCLKHKAQNRMLLAASYFFYGWWDTRFLILILVSTIVDYFCGIAIHRADRIRDRKIFLGMSVVANLTILGFFKYWNFFAGSLQSLAETWGLSMDPLVLNVVLPVGISFYTFQTMSYTIDIYRGQVHPTKKFLDFGLYVAFFPQLVAGPIERASRLLPQILTPRRVSLPQFESGCYLIFWGLFEKIFIADSMARIVNLVFVDLPNYSGLLVLVGLYAFAFQIFCDFDAYSNIARGVARCFGFEIMANFRQPYFATNPVDFWKRWHVSLSSWLRDYLYIPLGGNQKGKFLTFRNLMITMLLGGLWHGAAWTFVIWGAYQGILLVGHRLLQPLFAKIDVSRLGIPESLWRVVRVVIFFHLVCLGWLIFRAQSVDQLTEMLHGLFINFHLADISMLKYIYVGWKFPIMISLLLFIQWRQYKNNDLFVVCKWPFVIRWGFYTLLFHLMVSFGVSSGQEFIYFQF